MDTSLIINATNGNKKVTKAITNINPEKDNAILKTFAQKVNALTTNSYVDATRVDKMSVNEQDAGGSTTPTVTGLLNPNLHRNGVVLTWDGDGVCSLVGGEVIEKEARIDSSGATYVLTSDGTYAKDWFTDTSSQPQP